MIKTFILALIVLYVFWLIWNFISLIYKNSRAVCAFKKLEKLFIKRYELLGRLFRLDENKQYLDELNSLPAGVSYVDRKLALNYVLSEYIKQNYSNDSLPDEYKIVTSELKNVGDRYNLRAKILKQAVEIFPKSFYARFLNIKVMDFYRG